MNHGIEQSFCSNVVSFDFSFLKIFDPIILIRSCLMNLDTSRTNDRLVTSNLIKLFQ